MYKDYPEMVQRFLEAKKWIECYNDNPLTFIYDMRQLDIKTYELDLYWDLMQFLYCCDINKNSKKQYISQIKNKFGYFCTNSGFGYKKDKYDILQSRRPPNYEHIYTLLNFFNLPHDADYSPVMTPRFCNERVSNFKICGKILDKHKKICDLCVKHKIVHRYIRRREEMWDLPTEYTFRTRVPEIYLHMNL